MGAKEAAALAAQQLQVRRAEEDAAAEARKAEIARCFANVEHDAKERFVRAEQEIMAAAAKGERSKWIQTWDEPCNPPGGADGYKLARALNDELVGLFRGAGYTSPNDFKPCCMEERGHDPDWGPYDRSYWHIEVAW